MAADRSPGSGRALTRVLVTGATGFLGRRLVPTLSADGHAVTAHGRAAVSPFLPAIDYVHADLTDRDQVAALLAPARWDVIVHLAGPVTGGGEDWAGGVEVVHAHHAIASNLRRWITPGMRVIHASSMTVYGDPQTAPVTEDHRRAPRHLYALAKSIAEDVWLTDPRIDAWVLRLPGLFSAQRRGGALFHFCRAAAAGAPVRVTTAEPTPWNILDLDDAATAILGAVTASARAPGAINIAYAEPVELVAVARRIAELGGRGSVVEHPAGVTHPIFQLAIDRARELLGWSPPALDTRLAELLTAYSSESP